MLSRNSLLEEIVTLLATVKITDKILVEEFKKNRNNSNACRIFSWHSRRDAYAVSFTGNLPSLPETGAVSAHSCRRRDGEIPLPKK